MSAAGIHLSELPDSGMEAMAYLSMVHAILDPVEKSEDISGAPVLLQRVFIPLPNPIYRTVPV